MKHFGTVKKGKIIFKDKIRLKNNLIELEGKEIVLRVRESEDGRSIEQNALWWKWMEIIGNEIGMNKEETHTLLKYKFLKRDVVKEDGTIETVLKGTSTLTVEEFNKLMSEVLFFANDTLNVRLPSND